MRMQLYAFEVTAFVPRYSGMADMARDRYNTEDENHTILIMVDISPLPT